MAEEDARDFVLNQDDLELEKNADGKLFKIDDSYEGILENPINKTLSIFQDKFMENERFTYELFLQLDDVLRRLTKEINENYYYDNMDIVKIFREAITRYQSWMSVMRRNILMTKGTMKEIKETIEEQYVPSRKLDELREELEVSLEEYKEEFFIRKVRKSGQQLVVYFPAGLIKTRKINEGDFLKMKKISSSLVDEKDLTEKDE